MQNVKSFYGSQVMDSVLSFNTTDKQIILPYLIVTNLSMLDTQGMQPPPRVYGDDCAHVSGWVENC